MPRLTRRQASILTVRLLADLADFESATPARAKLAQVILQVVQLGSARRCRRAPALP